MSFSTRLLSVCALVLGLWAASLPAGSPFGLAAPINPNAASDPALYDAGVSVATNGTGVWVAAWITHVTTPSSLLKVAFSRSTDDGATWSQPTIPVALPSRGSPSSVSVFYADTNRWMISW